jgi:hypothetical protein
MTELDGRHTPTELRAELEAVLRTIATKDDVAALRDELLRHFAILLESIRAEFRTFYDALAGQPSGW